MGMELRTDLSLRRRKKIARGISVGKLQTLTNLLVAESSDETGEGYHFFLSNFVF